MLRVSLQILPLAALLPRFWGAVGALLITALVVRRVPLRRAHISPAQWRWELACLAAGPVALLAWGLYKWPPNGTVPLDEAAALVTLNVIGALTVGVALFLVWRHRDRFWRTVGIAAAGLWWGSGSYLTAAMAITNSWL
jgi:hypothetical protein